VESRPGERETVVGRSEESQSRPASVTERGAGVDLGLAGVIAGHLGRMGARLPLLIALAPICGRVRLARPHRTHPKFAHWAAHNYRPPSIAPPRPPWCAPISPTWTSSLALRADPLAGLSPVGPRRARLPRANVRAAPPVSQPSGAAAAAGRQTVPRLVSRPRGEKTIAPNHS